MIKRISPKRKKELATYVKSIKQMKEIENCQDCGFHESRLILGLQHHHIIYRSEAPKHVNLHHLRNLLKLCQACHQKYHDNKDFRRDMVQWRELWELFPELRLKERYIEN